MGGGYNKAKTQIKSQISQKERLEAEEALRSLKQKMANAPKKPIKQSSQRSGGGFNQINKKPNNNFDYGMDYGMDNYNIGGGGNYNQMPKKTGAKTTVGKKPMGNNNILRTGGMKMNNQFGGGMKMNNQFGGGFGGGISDNRPIGGGLTADQMPNEDEITSPCPHCGRKFNQISFPKHVKNCQKVFQKKRKAFNTQKQRIIDSEQASLMRQGALEAKRNPKLNKPKGGIPKWKLQSMEFRSICNPGKANKIRKEMGFGGMNMNNKMGMGMNNMKGGKMAKGKGGIGGSGFGSGGCGMNMGGGFGGGMDIMGMGGYVPSAIPLDYTHCQYCNRNYNEEAYNKHLNGCKRRYEEAQMRNKITKKSTGGKAPVKSTYGRGPINYPKYNVNKTGKKK